MYSCKLENGVMIPCIGLGVWQLRDEKECIEAVTTALEAGYRHIDTAQVYGNEEFVGRAVAASGIDRKDVFITTKIARENFSADRLVISYEESLKKLGTSHADLLLLHFPVTETRAAAWPIMEQLYEQKKARAIGVSNYTITHLKELLAVCKVKPAVNQVELHVYLQQPELLAFCRENGIMVEAYSPLAHGTGLDNPTLEAIAQKHNASVAQIMIAWCLCAGTIPLPKAAKPEHITANLMAFDIKLDAEDMAVMKELDQNLRTAWDPSDVA